MADLINGLGGVAGFGENTLTRNDDYYASDVSLVSAFGAGGLNFFGTNYTVIAINNNGNITFGSSGLSTFTPFGMQTGGYAIIAPFFADVDTRGDNSSDPLGPNVVTPTPGGTSQGSNLVYYDFDATGFGTLTVTWDDVGYYSSATDKLNAFQLQLVGTGSGNFDAIFRYEAVNWTTGGASGGTGGLGGTVARAGYSTGDGTSWYELAQSGIQDQMLALETTAGNTGVAGYYRFSVYGGTDGPDTLNGAGNDDVLAGGAGSDTLNGGEGNDTLNGGVGADTLVGGVGGDTYIVDDAGDVLVELAGEGTDTVQSLISFTLGDNFEDLVLTGTAAINGTGNALDNVLAGNSGDNILDGSTGSDTVSYETYTSALTIDLSLTTPQSLNGQDTLLNIENCIGTFYGDTLMGSSAANTLNGNLGADTMSGGLGNDTYYVDNAGDSVTETGNVSGNSTLGFRLALDLSGNIDKVVSSINYTLGNYLENLDLAAGSGNLTGTGNTLDNTLTGNEGNNTFSGGAGNDTIDGGAGIDSATYANRANFALAQSGTGFTLTDSTGAEGADTLTNTERLTFADTRLALDVVDDHAWAAAKILGAVFGASSVSNTDYLNIGVSYLDGGTSYADLMALALNAAGATTNSAVVSLLWTNLFGAAPTVAEAAPYVAMLDSGSYTAGALGAMAADTSYNTGHLDVTGLAHGNAGIAAKILGAVFGASSLSNKTYVGIGLGYLDGGTSYADLMALALNAAGATTNSAVVSLLWTNLFGVAPSSEEAAPYVAMLDSGSYTAGALGVLAADTSFNIANINLVGLAQSGVEFA